MNYYNEIKNKLIDNEIYSKTKDYSKERNKVITYFEIGKLLYEAGSIYGEDIIGQYSKKLIIEVGKSYKPRTLRRIRQYYLTFRKEKWSLLATRLTWSHYTELLPIKDENKYNYIDLLLYNIKFKCYVINRIESYRIEKKHIGQIQTYMNYIDKKLKTIEENKTIGIIIVKKNDKYIMEYCSNKRIISKEYKLVS